MQTATVDEKANMTPRVRIPAGQRSYTFAEVTEFTAVDRPLLARWLTAGLFRPEFGGAGASGVHRRFSFRNLVEITVATWLYWNNVSTAGILQVLHAIRDLDDDASRGGPSHEAIQRQIVAAPSSSLEWRLAGAKLKDIDTARWREFKRRTKKDGVGLFVLRFSGALDRQHLDPIHFIDAFEQLAALLAEDEPGIVGKLPVTFLIDIAQIVGDLEEETGDSFATT